MRKTISMFAATVCATALALALLVTCVSVGSRPASAAASITYTLTDLGTLGGATIARDINDSGQAVGQLQTAAGNRAFLWQNGQINDLGVLETKNPDGTTTKYTSSEAWHINDFGVAVGRSFISSSQGRAVLCGRMARLRIPKTLASLSRPLTKRPPTTRLGASITSVRWSGR